MRARQFIINSIKMDLFRIVTAVGNLNNTIPFESVNEFINHAINDFNKTELTESDIKLKSQLESLRDSLNLVNDPHTRLRWTEDVLTIRCRL